MPSIMIHAKVGYSISKKIHRNSYDYYLGLIAPDAPNLNGFAPKEERWTAHQRKENYQEWRKSLLDFYQQQKDNYSKDFIIGYYIHILTDIVFDDFIYLKVREEILKKYPLEQSHEIMSNDMNQYYFEEVKEIKKILEEKDDSYQILNIEKDLLLNWKKRLLSINISSNKSMYIKPEIIQYLEEQVYKELVETIEI